MSAKNGIYKKCEFCGKSFYVSQAKKDRKRFCSRQCLGKENAERLNRVRKKATDNPAWFKSENVKGSNNPKWVESLAFVCEHCGETFYRKPWQATRANHKFRYCSCECRDEWRRENMTGENSPTWVGGYETYRGRNWPKIRLQVVRRQEGKCASCGKHVGKSLPVHHIKPYRLFERTEDANAIENLIGLCQSCHMKHEAGNMGIRGVVAKEEWHHTCTCADCGKTFASKNPRGNWCEDCRAKICQHCGKSFRAILRKEANKFCSRECHYEYRRQN